MHASRFDSVTLYNAAARAASCCGVAKTSSPFPLGTKMLDPASSGTARTEGSKEAAKDRIGVENFILNSRREI